MTAAAPASGGRLTLVARVVPMPLGSRRAGRLIERNLLVQKTNWVVLLSGFFEPLFYLLSIGIGIGKLVGPIQVGHHLVAYRTFVAPAMLASSAMNGAITETTFNVFHKLHFSKLYSAMLATSVQVSDVAIGEIGWALMRGGSYSAVFLVVMAALGLITSWWALLALPAALLLGAAFAAVGMAGTTYMRGWQDFDYVPLATLPLFLFSATFYPLATYAGGLQAVVRVTPLYQGVALLRSLTTGGITLSAAPALLAHVAYLVVMVVVGLALTQRRLAALLLT